MGYNSQTEYVCFFRNGRHVFDRGRVCGQRKGQGMEQASSCQGLQRQETDSRRPV